MIITLYDTRLPADYSRVVNNIAAYLAKAPTHEYDVPPVNAGADTLELSFPIDENDPRAYNYARIDNTYYFVTNWRFTLPNTATCTAVFDYWHNTENITVSGNLLNSHDMADVLLSLGARGRYASLRYPVEPICGDFIRTNWDQNGENDTGVCVLAHLTIYQGNVERDVLVNSPSYSILNDRTLIRAFIGNIARGKELGNFEIRSINQVWLVPQWLPAQVTGATNYEITVGGDSGKIGVYWNTAAYNTTHIAGAAGVERHIYYNSNPDIKVPIFVKYGNFATNIDIPLVNLFTEVEISCAYDAGTGDVSMFLRYRDESVDLMPSLSVSFSSGRITERELSRKISNAVGIGTQAITVGAGIATGNVAAVAIGVGGLASNLSSAVAKPAKQIQTAHGNAFANLTQLRWRDISTANTSQWVCGAGFMEYACANEGDVIDALTRVGYAGNIYLDNFNLNVSRETSTIDPSFVYTASFRRFADNAVLWVDGDGINNKARDVLRDILVNGTIVFYTDDGVMKSPKINYTVQPSLTE